MLRIVPIPVLKDNYAYLLCAPCGAIAVVDPGETEPIKKEIETLGGRLDYIMFTHHHADHIGAGEILAQHYGASLIGNAKDAGRLPPLTYAVEQGTVFFLGATPITVLETPGHTLGAVCYYLPEAGAIFTGDTLFLMGCGRLFEGTAQQMWASLCTLAALPPKTHIYPGHEYTLQNGVFCASVEPNNEALLSRLESVRTLRSKGQMTVPGTMAEEMATNVFLRARSLTRFAEIRHLKDRA